MKITGIILAGGSGGRFGSKIPKQYMSLNGKLVIQYVIDAFNESHLFNEIIVVMDKKYKHLVKGEVKIVKQGKTRKESVLNALKECSNQSEIVLFHDSVRPFIKSTDLVQYINNLKDYTAVVTYEPITDALFYGKREDFRLVQTPEAFKVKGLREKIDKCDNFVGIYESLHPCPIKFIKLNHCNLKITYAEDLYLAEQLMKYESPIKRESDVYSKDILVLGGTGGIGKSLTNLLLESGAKVDSLGSKDIDLSKDKIIIPDNLKNKKWDSIIHTAGAYCQDKEGLLKNYNKIFNVNFKSAIYLLENASNLIKPNGSIIFVGSTAATKGRKNIALYSSTKSALNTLVEGMVEPLKEHKIRVHVVCPAKVATNLQRHINPTANFDEMIQPESIARIIAGYIDFNETGHIVYVKVGQE
jgi:ribitol-5-phosphate 2-dehydrogenase (NADP+) / D-ribitol-5-phosphate cytidylyltransferase